MIGLRSGLEYGIELDIAYGIIIVMVVVGTSAMCSLFEAILYSVPISQSNLWRRKDVYRAGSYAIAQRG